jgi:hypothetical protein
VIEMQARGGGEHPGIAAKGSAALKAGLDALELLVGKGLIDMCGPIAWDLDWPFRKDFMNRGIAEEPMVEAAVGPGLSAADEVGGKGISFDIAEECQEMFIALNRKGFEAILVEVAVANRVMGGSPADGVGVGEPAEEGGKLSVFSGPNHEMPVGRHETEGKKADGVALVGLEEDAQKGIVIGGFAEHFHAADGAVENVVDEAAGSNTRVSGHERIIIGLPGNGNNCPRPGFSPRFFPSWKWNGME